MGNISEAYISGNFETQTQNLGMRPQVCCRPNTTIKEVYERIIFLGK